MVSKPVKTDSNNTASHNVFTMGPMRAVADRAKSDARWTPFFVSAVRRPARAGNTAETKNGAKRRQILLYPPPPPRNNTAASVEEEIK